MTDYLDALREYFIDTSGWDKMGRKRPDNDWADDQINALTNAELLCHIDSIRSEITKKEALT